MSLFIGGMVLGLFSYAIARFTQALRYAQWQVAAASGVPA